ncbi:MAG: CYTH domain-containing protein [Bacteroidota bacterium]
MPTEIEHKYLVNEQLWAKVCPDESVQIKQAYLLSDSDKTLRVRTAGDKGFITIKGKTVGATRPEFEYEIPLNDANELISDFCTNIIEKTRHYVYHENKTWEVDVFEGLNSGLIVAEIELDDEAEMYKKPNWVEENVTYDAKYANSNLIIYPYSAW